MVFARDVDLLVQDEYNRLEVLRVRVGKLIWGLYSSIAKQARKVSQSA